MKETISILGCGWLGMPLGERLVNSGYHVKGSTTREEKMPAIIAAGMEPYIIGLSPESEGDIESFLDTDILFINIPPGKGDGLPGFYLRQMQALLERVVQSRVRKVILISATSVYPQNNCEVTEDDAVRIESPFMDTPWLDVEDLFTKQATLKTTILRFFRSDWWRVSAWPLLLGARTRRCRRSRQYDSPGRLPAYYRTNYCQKPLW